MKRDGITSVVYNLIQATDPSTVSFDLVAINEPDRSLRDSFEKIGVKIHVIPRSAKGIFRYVANLRRLIRAGCYDAVHIHGSSATLALELIAAWMAGCKKRIAHSHNTSCKYKALHYALKPIVQMLSTHRLACGEAAGKWLYSDGKFEVICNGVDTERFSFSKENRETVRRQLGISQSDIAIGHVGAFNEVKNQAFLLDILAKLPQKYKLVFLGEGALRASVREKAGDMGLTGRVVFAGAVADPERYYSAFDAMTLPSFHEGLPLTLVEAQANGLQCLVSDRVTDEVNLTDHVVFLPIDQGTACWVEHCAVPAPLPLIRTLPMSPPTT